MNEKLARWCELVEKTIAKIAEQNMADPRIEKLLDLEADAVLKDYYQSDEYKKVMEAQG